MDKRDMHYFPVCSFCKFPHDRLEPCPVADKAIEELVCSSCAALRARIEDVEGMAGKIRNVMEDQKDWDAETIANALSASLKEGK